VNSEEIVTMSRSEKTQGIIWLEQLAAEAMNEARILRENIEAEARADYERGEGAPTWRIPDIGRISASISKGGVFVSDEKVFADWVMKRYPTEVETVQQVRASFVAGFLKRVRAAGERVFDPQMDGEVVPGLSARKGGVFKGISITPDDAAKQVFGALAQHGLRKLALEAGPAVPVVLAEVEG
jgi:hypothetical protein